MKQKSNKAKYNKSEITKNNESNDNNDFNAHQFSARSHEILFDNDFDQSPRGRKVIDESVLDVSFTKVKNQNYRNSSSRSTNRLSGRQANRTYYSNISDTKSEQDQYIANLTSKLEKLKMSAAKFSDRGDLSNRSIENTSPDTKIGKSSCNCSSCCQRAGSEYSEEQSLSKEIYHIIYDVCEAHIKNQDIKETVRRYQQSVFEFCVKESQSEIIYLVKFFTKMLSKSIEVSQIKLS